jgi:hypothetical protein
VNKAHVICLWCLPMSIPDLPFISRKVQKPSWEEIDLPRPVADKARNGASYLPTWLGNDGQLFDIRFQLTELRERFETQKYCSNVVISEGTKDVNFWLVHAYKVVKNIVQNHPSAWATMHRYRTGTD